LNTNRKHCDIGSQLATRRESNYDLMTKQALKVSSTATVKRTRLSPEARRNQILDVAKQSIADDGLQIFSLKQLAKQAGVSEPLLFHYFSSRVELLQQLLQREYENYLESVQNSLKSTNTLEEVCRIFVSRNYDHHDEDNVMDLLLSEPEVATTVEKQQNAHHKQRRKLLINVVAQDVGVNRKKAAMLVRMASAASIAAAKFAHENTLSREETIQSVMDFIAHGFQSQNKK
jgi:AcrR family transcriptional regulator